MNLGKRILLVEDDPSLTLVLKDGLTSEGFEVLHAGDGPTGLAMAQTEQPDLIVLDIMLPGKSGLEVCRLLRAAKNPVPMIILTAKGTEIDRVVGLKMGADDYMVKPFSLAELVARMEALWRRDRLIKGHAKSEPAALGEIVLNFQTHQAHRAGTPLSLTPREFRILEYFYHRPQKVISRLELLREVWGHEGESNTRTVDTHIANLRKKLEANPEQPKYLITIHGLGYSYRPS